MKNKSNFKKLLKYLEFKEKNNTFSKNFESECSLSVDFLNEKLQYPEAEGLKINERQTCNFSAAENFVVFECVHKLLEKGYKPKHIELEPRWKLGHGASGGRADILVKNQKDKPILIIECKTYGKEFKNAWKDTQKDGGQLFSYAQQISETEFLCLYASEFDGKNSQILTEQRIISHKDNEKILELGEGLKSFKDASNVKNRFEVWDKTYQLEYTQTGVFEKNIQPYQIGKSNYTLDIDTRPVTEKDKEGKYDRFRTILRQHNIARKETAFEVLVNLFLAKIVDEEENKDNLDFFWKGVAYDNYYDFIDRLQKLYQIGMKKFLKDEVMYISSEKIDGAFWTVKNKKNATKKQIQKYFRDLKFFSNNAFSLINVHNERLFNRNTKVLVELVQMWQGLRLKDKEQNQFLGDMFEFFLDNSIKQSEGQFFTPMPITKFIVASLPLEDKIQKTSEPLKVIDYACGSGHFLTEYAHQIKPLVKKYKQTGLSQYYENITGIEKEDRLAKIAKVSAYMYGQDQIKIIEKDALIDITEIKLASYDVLVANPPFAVKGFLLNLDDKQKENYELIKTTESNTNNIQCFFLERAKQLMNGGGVAGVIVPSSILSNSDSTHIATREIILKYFDIIALVELGSGTFGKTGTNTVVLFLRRKDKKPEPAEHYQNRVDDYFEINLADQIEGRERLNSNISEYQDIGIIKAYCQHNELIFDEYIKLFGITADIMTNLDELFKTDIFADYKKDFENSTEIKNYKNKKVYKDKTKEEKELELNKRLIKHIYKIEKDKLFYFMLAFENPQKVLIVKSPNNNKEQKKFLGYEWSGAKGSEGIKYNGGSTVNDIITPLFNPKNLQDKTKINTLIEQNFLGSSPSDLSELEEYQDLISYASAADILDFSRKDFNKAFSLSPKKNIVIDTKWELVRLGEVAEIQKGKSITQKDTKKGNIKVVAGGLDFAYLHNKSNRSKNTITISASGANAGFVNIWAEEIFASDCTTVLGKNNTENYYFYEILKTIQNDIYSLARGAAQPHVYPDDIKALRIPLPPKVIQEKIVSECEAVDKASETAQETIDEAKANIEKIVEQVKGATESLDNLMSITRGASPRPIRNYLTEDVNGINWIKIGDVSAKSKYITKTNQKITVEGSRKSRIVKKGDFILSNSMSYGRPYILDIEGCVHDGWLILADIDKKINKDYLFNILLSKSVQEQFSGLATGTTVDNLNISRVQSVKIPVPPLSAQKTLVSQIEILENKISQAQEIIDKTPAKKQQILDKHLK